ncbi:hypothetical protein R6Q57_000307 [Mikania cordata]
MIKGNCNSFQPEVHTPRASPWSSDSMRYRSDNIQFPLDSAGPSLDLQLSISLRPIQPPADHCIVPESFGCRDSKPENGRIEALKWHAADQIRIRDDGESVCGTSEGDDETRDGAGAIGVLTCTAHLGACTRGGGESGEDERTGDPPD